MTTYPDPYGECENAVKELMLEITDFFRYPWSVSNNDTNIARGGDYFVVLRPGAFPLFQQSNTGKIKDYDWNIVFDLYVRYTEYEESWKKFKAVRAAVIYVLDNNPILLCTVKPDASAKNVWGTGVASDENAQYFTLEGSEEARPNFIIQTMSVIVRQRVEYPF